MKTFGILYALAVAAALAMCGVAILFYKPPVKTAGLPIKPPTQSLPIGSHSYGYYGRTQVRIYVPYFDFDELEAISDARKYCDAVGLKGKPVLVGVWTDEDKAKDSVDGAVDHTDRDFVGQITFPERKFVWSSRF